MEKLDFSYLHLEVFVRFFTCLFWVFLGEGLITLKGFFAFHVFLSLTAGKLGFLPSGDFPVCMEEKEK